MRLLTDEDVPESLAHAIELAGHDVARGRDCCRGAADPTVLALAAAEARLLLTRDLGYGELVVRRRRPSAGVMLLRFARPELAAITRTVVMLLQAHGTALHGCFTVVQPDRARFVRLLSPP